MISPLVQLAPTLTVMVVGGLMYLLRSIPTSILNTLGWYATVTLTVNNDDPCFDWINEWLAAHSYAKRARKLKVESGREPDAAWTISPGYGTHWFWDNGLVIVTRTAIESKTSISWQRQESFTIRTLGRSQEKVRRLINYASFVQKRTEAVGIRMWLGGSWQRLQGRGKRSLKTLYMPPDVKREMVECARWFFDEQSWFTDRGIPYRQGFMLYGPPGTGKTTAVIALASEFGKPIYILNLATIKDDNELMLALSLVPQGAIVLIEDIDAAKATEIRTEDSEKITVDKGITLSGLLNAIDGVAAPEGRLLIMTTNHPDKVDPAVTRSARIDKHFYFGPLPRACVFEMAERFFPTMPAGLYQAIASIADEKPAANWQDALMAVERSKNVADLAIELARERVEVKPITYSAAPASPPMESKEAA